MDFSTYCRTTSCLHRRKRSLETAHCGSEDVSVNTWMRSVQSSEVPTTHVVKRSAQTRSRSSASAMYSREANRHRRQIDQRKTCSLFLLTDYEMWRYMREDLEYVSSCTAKCSFVASLLLSCFFYSFSPSLALERKSRRFSRITWPD